MTNEDKIVERDTEWLLKNLSQQFEFVVQLLLSKENKAHQANQVLTSLKFARLAFPEVQEQFLVLEKQVAACKAAQAESQHGKPS